MPAQFIKTPVFGIRFPFDDPLVFVRLIARLGLYSILGQSRLGMIGHASQFMEMQKLCNSRR